MSRAKAFWLGLGCTLAVLLPIYLAVAAVIFTRSAPADTVQSGVPIAQPTLGDEKNFLLMTGPEQPETFVLLRFDALEGNLCSVAIPGETVVLVNGRPATLADAAEQAGPAQAAAALMETLDIEIDNYLYCTADRLVDLATHVLEVWRGYTDEAAFVFAETDGEPHNTITPIARKVGDMYELDLTLRNNITTEEHPLGVYHPHAQYHHIKKENIGLIEVMGLAVLPARLKEELELLEEYILEGKDIASNEKIEKHAAWAAEFLPKYDNINKDNVHEILQKEVGIVFTHVLEDAGVYKCTPEGREAFMRFIETL